MKTHVTTTAEKAQAQHEAAIRAATPTPRTEAALRRSGGLLDMMEHARELERELHLVRAAQNATLELAHAAERRIEAAEAANAELRRALEHIAQTCEGEMWIHARPSPDKIARDALAATKPYLKP